MTHFQQGGCGMSHREKKKFTHNFSKETWMEQTIQKA